MIYSNEDFIYVSTSGRLFHARTKNPKAKRYQECRKALTEKGYLKVGMEGRRKYQHRIVWEMVHSQLPEQIDHINGVRSDNRLCNLRAADYTVNARNAKTRKDNSSGLQCIRQRGNRWSVQVQGKHVGTYDSLSSAIHARDSLHLQQNFHPNHGR